MNMRSLIPWGRSSNQQAPTLYREGDQYLYVNRGYGCIGYPGRVGMPPELTVIELKRG